MDSIEVGVLTEHAPPVLKMPGRRFPGVLIQGDSLSVLVSDARDLARRLAVASSEAAEDADLLAAALAGMLDHYAAALRQHGIALPYVQ